MSISTYKRGDTPPIGLPLPIRNAARGLKGYFLSKDRKVDAAILAMLHEARMLREVVVFAMLEHKETVRSQQRAF